MIIKLINPTKGRNRLAFQPFVKWSKLFNELNIQFTTSGNSDYTFIGFDDFVDRKLSLEDSINKGTEFVNQYKHENVILFDPSDSTSLLGIYEVLDNCPFVKFLIKNQILDFNEYEKPTPFNKWFFNPSTTDVDINKGYKIKPNNFGRIRLSGWNLGFLNSEYHIFAEDRKADMPIDLCAIYQYQHDENRDHGFRNDIAYTEHRYGAYEALKESTFKWIGGTYPREQYYDYLSKSKLALSPFGMGEICYRDFELMRLGIPMIKPDMSKVITEPSIYIPWKTYIPVKPDWSNLNDVVEKVLSDYDTYKIVNENFRKTFRYQYLVSSLTIKWLNFLNS